MAWHALLTGIVKPPQKKTNVINFINFFGSEKRQITELFARFGVEPLFLPAGTTVDQLSRMSESIATVSICGTLGTYLGNGLENNTECPMCKPYALMELPVMRNGYGGLEKSSGKKPK